MVLSTRLFSYHADRRLFTAEASTLELPLGKIPTRFHLESHQTGQRRLFAHAGADTDDEGEVTGHRYTCGDLDVLIIND